MSATVASLMLQLRTDLSGFRKMFNQLGARATAWWPEQEPAKRTKFLSSCAPDADTAAALAPRWTAEGLSHGEDKAVGLQAPAPALLMARRASAAALGAPAGDVCVHFVFVCV